MTPMRLRPAVAAICSQLLLLASVSHASLVKIGNTTILGTISTETGLERFAGML